MNGDSYQRPPDIALRMNLASRQIVSHAADPSAEYVAKVNGTYLRKVLDTIPKYFTVSVAIQSGDAESPAIEIDPDGPPPVGYYREYVGMIINHVIYPAALPR